MRAKQESNEHQQKEYRIGCRNGDGTSQATMCVREEADIESRVVFRSNLFQFKSANTLEEGHRTNSP
jgi:hypothetical protein